MSSFDRYLPLWINSLFTFYIMNRQMSDSRIIIVFSFKILCTLSPSFRQESVREGGGGEYEIMKMGLVGTERTEKASTSSFSFRFFSFVSCELGRFLCALSALRTSFCVRYATCPSLFWFVFLGCGERGGSLAF